MELSVSSASRGGKAYDGLLTSGGREWPVAFYSWRAAVLGPNQTGKKALGKSACPNKRSA